MTASQPAGSRGILHGIRILDLSQMVPGQYCTKMLADCGAEVIRIESAAGGESGSSPNPNRGKGHTGTGTSLNHAKKSVALDLATETGVSALKHLVAGAHVLVENCQPGAMERMGLNYETLARLRPGLVYASISQSGELQRGKTQGADGSSQDIYRMSAQAGPFDETGNTPGSGIGEAYAGAMMSFGIIAALRQAEATGKSQLINLALQDCAPDLGEWAIERKTMRARSPAPVAAADPLPLAITPLRFNGALPPAPGAASALGADTQTYLAEPARTPIADDAKRALRNAFGAFATGVTIVTTRQPDGTPRGFTANSFTSVSLDPPMLLICIAKTAHSCDTFTSADHFTVNILGENQKEVSGLFASRQTDKFDQTDWYAGHADMPVITGSLASFICGREKLVNAGDHIVLIGRVEEFTTTPGAPLGYHEGAYFSVGAEDPLVNAAARVGNVRIGALLRKDQEILLTKTPDGSLGLPCAPDGKLGHEGLLSWLSEQGLQPDPQNLYAVFEDNTAGKIGIYYHGTMQGTASAEAEFVAIGAIPFERISNSVERSMLRRYAREYQHGSFGIYQGNQDSGTVHHLAPNAPHTN